MDIKPNEVESITHIGHLHGDEVKIVKCIGGYNLVIGKKKKTDRKAEVITAGSHQAICIHEMEKMFKDEFKLKMNKNEHEAIPVVEDHTGRLSKNMAENGVKLYSLEKNASLEVVLYKHGITLSKYEISNGYIDMTNGNTDFFKKIDSDDKLELSKSIAKLIEDKTDK